MEQEFTLISCLSSSTSEDVRYIDSGASFHIIRVWEYFSSDKEGDIIFQIQIGNKSKCNIIARGISFFPRNNGKLIPIHDVFHV